jgi:acetyltransferase-like isoleucine patch superfamily enzyme
VVVNQCCTIGHDSIVENFAQVCPGARISGWVKVGEGTLLGSNSVAAPRVTLGSWAVLAASSFASQNLLDGVTALGIPAKPLFKNTGSKPNKENA